MGRQPEIVKVVIPSYHRASRVRALAIPNSVVCVPQSEYDEYVKYCGKDRVVAHPDDVIGIGPKRQWIIEKFKNVFMIDDEYDHLVRCYLPEGSEENAHCTPEETYDIIQATARLTKELGTYLFGFSKTAKPLYFNPADPFGVCVSASNLIYYGIGILDGGEIFVPKDLNYNEDDFISLINCFNNRFCFVDKRFSYPFAQNDKNGMTTAGKNIDEWNKNARRLVQYFSPLVRLDGENEDGSLKVKIGKAFE